jgi:hypothetical protein
MVWKPLFMIGVCRFADPQSMLAASLCCELSFM